MGRPKSYDRATVVDQARDLFWAKGYEGTHLAELVEVTGLNRFSLYNEFDGKDGLFLAALERYLEETEQHYERILGREPLGLGNVVDYFEGIRFAPDYHGCFLINTLTEQHVVATPAFERAAATARLVERRFRDNLRAAADDGTLPHDRDTDGLAKFCTALDQGLSIYGIVSPRTRDKNLIVGQLRVALGVSP